MEAFFIYLLKSAGVTTLFLGCYYIFLSKETFFNQNRIFLITGLLLSFIIPLITYTKTIWVSVTPLVSNNLAEQIVSIPAQENLFDLYFLLFFIYSIGVIVFTIRLAIQLLSLKKLISNGTILKKDEFCFIETDQDTAPFSFFNYIVYNPNQYTKIELDAILTHEKTHVKELHSLDILFIHLMTIFQWFNPFIWIYKKYIGQNIEFIADTKALKKNQNKSNYQYLMLKTSTGENNFSIANQFFNSSIKKRIMMINQKQSKKVNILKSFLILPAIALFLVSFNTKKLYKTIADESNTVNQTDSRFFEFTIHKNTSDKELKLMKKDLAKNNIDFSYTVVHNAKKEIIDISLQMSGESDGKKFSSSYASNDERAIKPIKIIYNDTDKNITIGNLLQDHNKIKIPSNEDGTTPLIIINGKESSQKDMDNLNPGAIASIDVLKGIKTVNKYGDKAKDGVIEIILKKNEEFRIQTVINNTTPLFIINGKESSQKDMNDLNHDTIESIDVLKGEKAIQKYGDKGKDGVMEIILKKNKKLQKIKIESFFNHDELLFIVDGKETSKEDMDKLNQESFESVNVLKGEKAIQKYGDKGKNGVMEIILKK